MAASGLAQGVLPSPLTDHLFDTLGSGGAVETRLNGSGENLGRLRPVEHRFEPGALAADESTALVGRLRAVVQGTECFEASRRELGALVGHKKPIFRKIQQDGSFLCGISEGVLGVLQQLKQRTFRIVPLLSQLAFRILADPDGVGLIVLQRLPLLSDDRIVVRGLRLRLVRGWHRWLFHRNLSLH